MRTRITHAGDASLSRALELQSARSLSRWPSLTLTTPGTTLRRLQAMRKGLLLGATTLLVVSGALLATRPSRALRDFRRAADDLVARSDAILQRASTFDADAALRALGPSRWNAEYYRLDEHLGIGHESRLDHRGRRRRLPRSRPHSISTGGRGALPSRGQCATFENGTLKMHFAPAIRSSAAHPGSRATPSAPSDSG